MVPAAQLLSREPRVFISRPNVRGTLVAVEKAARSETVACHARRERESAEVAKAVDLAKNLPTKIHLEN